VADDQEKTEEPTPKKIEDARKEGNVPKSQDTSGVITLFVAILAVLMLFPYMARHMLFLFQYYFSLIGTPLDRLFMVDIALVTIREFLLIIMPLAIAVAISGVIAALAQFGFLFTTKAIMPDFKKIDPIKGTKNLFSMKKLQMQASRKRMMAEVPNADVIITNPTHYAVAIKYDEQKSHAPIVVAKGMDNIALQIKKIARENSVHIVQNPPLARSLYAEVDIDKPIPEALFGAVAEVLAYVYKMNRK